MTGAGRVVANVLRAAGLQVRAARRATRTSEGEIIISSPRYPSRGTVVTGPATLGQWQDRWAPADDESAAPAVAAAIIAWMASQPATPAGHPAMLRILPPPGDYPRREAS